MEQLDYNLLFRWFTRTLRTSFTEGRNAFIHRGSSCTYRSFIASTAGVVW